MGEKDSPRSLLCFWLRSEDHALLPEAGNVREAPSGVRSP